MRRREWITGATAGAMCGLPLRKVIGSDDGPALKDRAAARGLSFGSMIQYNYLNQSPDYAAAIARDCDIVVPGVEAKWYDTEPEDGRFNFTKLDAIADFARQHGMRLRLHNLVWSVWNPPWVDPALRTGRAEAILGRHIAAVVGRYAGRTAAWDVLNEVADPRWPSGPDGLCRTQWWHALGPTYPDLAFHMAHAADPGASLFVNDDWLEYPQCGEKRAIYLRLIESWLKRGVPVHGFGLEAHLRPDIPFDAQAYRKFLADLAGMGLVIHVTELDVIDRDLPADIAARDRMVADTVERYLSVVLDEPAVKAVLTWGLSDQYSDLDLAEEARRPDRLPTRGAPLDSAFRRKPFWHALARAFDHAPIRQPS